MYICLCKGITDQDIREAIKTSASKKEIFKKLGVASDCGSCLEEALNIYNESSKSLPEVAKSNPRNYKKS
jgi:bacterioferritin-associated ferredoxin